MYFLCIMSLRARGFYNKNKKIKSIFTLFILLGLILTELRFGSEIYARAFIEKIGFSFVLFCTMFFFQATVLDELEISTLNNELNIYKYPELNKRDAQWLNDILNGKKYAAIAIDAKVSLGTVKNRLKIIFDVLGVGDKQGFLNKFSDFHIFYTPDQESSDIDYQSPISD